MGDRCTVELIIAESQYKEHEEAINDAVNDEGIDDIETSNGLVTFTFYDINYGNIEDCTNKLIELGVYYNKWNGSGYEYEEGNEYYREDGVKEVYGKGIELYDLKRLEEENPGLSLKEAIDIIRQSIEAEPLLEHLDRIQMKSRSIEENIDNQSVTPML